MTKATIYHNSQCSKSRATLQILKDHNIDVQEIYYLKTPPTEKELNKIVTMLNIEPIHLIRTGENIFKELGLKNTDQKTKAEWLKIMTTNPILIERPIVTINGKAVIGRPPEKVLEIIT